MRCRGAGSVTERNRCAANTHVRRRGAVSGAERHRGAAQTRAVQWQSAIVVPSTYTCATVTQSSGQIATAALPRQPYADMAPVQ